MKSMDAATPLPNVYIIILNWNGWRDTIECLESLQYSSYLNYRIVVVDNGSSDNSLEYIQDWAKGEILLESNYVDYRQNNKPLRVIRYDKIVAETGGEPEAEQELALLPSAKKLVLIQAQENLGFAGGNNLGIRYALANGADLIWLLNNDTVVESGTLLGLVQFMQSNTDYIGVTGQIRLYNQPSTIWNCGGELAWYGTRRYYYAGASVLSVPQNGFKRISFITCCAVLFRSSLFRESGLLSDRFFFGEEDFELSQRIKQHSYKLACLYSAIIYHKVSASVNTASSGNKLGKVYVYYLNRFIDMRHFWPKSVWHIWRFVYMLYILPMLKLRHNWTLRELGTLCRLLLRDSSLLDGVDKDTFEMAIGFKFGNRQ